MSYRVSDRGVSVQGVSDQGVSDRGVHVLGVSVQGVHVQQGSVLSPAKRYSHINILTDGRWWFENQLKLYLGWSYSNTFQPHSVHE